MGVLLTVVYPMDASVARCKHIVHWLKEGVSQQLPMLHHESITPPITTFAFCAHPETSQSLSRGKIASCSPSGPSQLQVVFLLQAPKLPG